MHEPRVPDRLIEQITRSAETLASCERTMRSSHALLATAHLQLERARDLHRHLDVLHHLHHQDTARRVARGLTEQEAVVMRTEQPGHTVQGLAPWATANGATVCDFCNAPTVGRDRTLFACADFERRFIGRGEALITEVCSCHTPVAVEPGDTVRTQRVVGGWLACPRCAKAIRANDRARLARIAAASPHMAPPDGPTGFVESRHPQTRHTASWREYCAALHLGFWLHRAPDG